MKLIKAIIHKYKSFQSDQEFTLNDHITILVGMNESGKTSALEAIAKTNYFQEDEQFQFNLTHDYPRREKKKIDKSGADPIAITSTYRIGDQLLKKISEDVGEGVLKSTTFSICTTYNRDILIDGVVAEKMEFINNKTKELGVMSSTLCEKLNRVSTPGEFDALASTYTDENYVAAFDVLKKYFHFNMFKNPIEEYIYRTYLEPNIPRFLYYDEYFALPSRISIEDLEAGKLGKNEYKTAKALFELADINISDIIGAEDFEDFIAELEATEATISEELFKYWQTNKNLNITFQIDKKEGTDHRNNTKIVEHVLDVRVKSKGVSLPLKNRSKGFNWFFSFLVWFKKIQEDKTSNYILLLDEPGLNLHASAQADLLRFLQDLSQDYQIIYTTHSPFMIPTGNLDRVRTVLETEKGSVISQSIQEKDPNTLFPLQAALGYDIAQNLFVSKKNLLVEGVSDLIILTAMSGILESKGRIGLSDDVTIVPTGGLEKVATFISLLRGSKLEMVCLLDSYTDVKGKAKMDKIITDKIIHKSKVRFFDEFLETHSKADLEDLFVKSDYLKLFNSAHPEYPDIKEEDLNEDINQIVIQINKQISKDRFNHYRPANEIVKIGADKDFFEEETLSNFENIFREINQLFT